MPVRPLLTVFGFLPCRAATVSTGDVLFLLGLGLYLVLFFARPPATAELDAVLEDEAEIVFLTHNINDGINGLL